MYTVILYINYQIYKKIKTPIFYTIYYKNKGKGKGKGKAFS